MSLLNGSPAIPKCCCPSSRLLQEPEKVRYLKNKLRIKQWKEACCGMCFSFYLTGSTPYLTL